MQALTTLAIRAMIDIHSRKGRYSIMDEELIWWYENGGDN